MKNLCIKMLAYYKECLAEMPKDIKEAKEFADLKEIDDSLAWCAYNKFGLGSVKAYKTFHAIEKIYSNEPFYLDRGTLHIVHHDIKISIAVLERMIENA